MPSFPWTCGSAEPGGCRFPPAASGVWPPSAVLSVALETAEAVLFRGAIMAGVIFVGVVGPAPQRVCRDVQLGDVEAVGWTFVLLSLRESGVAIV
jgi:hypothetical protein